MNLTQDARVAIAGGGLGGLVCARILQLHGRSVTVFERETSPDARSQGGTLDLHPGTGQAALRAAGLLDRFHALSRPEGQEWRKVDHVTAAAQEQEWPPGDEGAGVEDRPEIDRGHLRGLLLDSLAPGTVHWGRAVGGATPLGDGTCRLEFTDGATEDFDLVVGADGAWSRVRPAVSEAFPEYTGVTLIETGFDDSDVRHPELARLVGPGTLVAESGSTMLFAQRNSNGHIRTYVAFRTPQDWHTTAGVDLNDRAAMRAYLSKRLDGWAEGLRYALLDGDHDFVNRPLFALPVPHVWEHVPGVTLLGDAAHLMPPLGVGANHALLDGADLAQALVAEERVDDAVRAYEELMLPRSSELAKQCAEGLKHMVP
ncbi:FAD-dependent oxidoreductase [Streptomyces rimosus subsp. pseudoverticillatus]|uniref:FAD-dependent oxidoreductase n=1 Tax=Streptomyces rimosus TaxID=1927 RepID=UPI0006B28CDF|nr:FAD-dependent monooxygenase [Streptomyces rimosus]KOT98759.1 FAD-dependent oxidoreductase [Streptomyces rimosus subsp. pseudoverticillatus]